jgi:hypothetical protein
MGKMDGFRRSERGEKNFCVVFDRRKLGKNISACLPAVGNSAEKLFRASRLPEMTEKKNWEALDGL